jgi:hypothetical protein
MEQFLIASGLLAGDLFAVSGHRTALLDTKSGDNILAIPSVGSAKLLIWSLIAGSSERLLPDQLTRLENSARDNGQEKPSSTNWLYRLTPTQRLAWASARMPFGRTMEGLAENWFQPLSRCIGDAIIPPFRQPARSCVNCL